MNIDTSFLPKPIEGHMQIQPSVIDMWKSVKNLTDFRTMMEIGFNVGHSSVIVLSMFPDVTITSFDIGRNERTLQGADLVSNKFPHRHSFRQIDSVTLREEFKEGLSAIGQQDLIFIDGGHTYDVALSDIMMAKELGIKNILVDDSNMEEVARAINSVDFLEKVMDFNYMYKKGKKKLNNVTSTLFKLK
jgi:predicted O-methyltransferase YrrM